MSTYVAHSAEADGCMYVNIELWTLNMYVRYSRQIIWNACATYVADLKYAMFSELNTYVYTVYFLCTGSLLWIVLLRAAPQDTSVG